MDMRHVLVLGIVWLAGVASASAQISERLEIAAIVRNDRVSFEGGQNARLPVSGAGIAYRVWRDMRIEGEITTASGESSRSYEGDFISYAGPEATREELLRMAVIARRTTTNTPGLGFATAMAVETRHPGRVNLAARAGVSFRQYRYFQDMTILRVPDGVTFEQAGSALPDVSGHRGRGGLLFGLSVPLRVAGHLHVVPEARWVWGGPARIGNNYDEGNIGARVAWKF
jgi:hypothetical protein